MTQETIASPTPSATSEQAVETSKRSEQDNVKALQAQLTGQINGLKAQNQRLASQLREIETRDLDEDGKKDFRIKELEERLSEYDQRMQDYEVQMAKSRLFATIVANTGIPITELQDASDPDEAWRKGTEFLRKQSQKAVAKEPVKAKEEADKLDLGSGRAYTKRTEWEAALAEAIKRRDPVAHARLLRVEKDLEE